MSSAWYDPIVGRGGTPRARLRIAVAEVTDAQALTRRYREHLEVLSRRLGRIEVDVDDVVERFGLLTRVGADMTFGYRMISASSPAEVLACAGRLVDGRGLELIDLDADEVTLMRQEITLELVLASEIPVARTDGVKMRKKNYEFVRKFFGLPNRKHPAPDSPPRYLFVRVDQPEKLLLPGELLTLRAPIIETLRAQTTWIGGLYDLAAADRALACGLGVDLSAQVDGSWYTHRLWIR